MPCYKPLKAFRTTSGVVFSALRRHDIVGDIELPCGQCIGCRMRRASDWELRVMHEASLWDSNCFVTLTYSPGNLPANSSLEYRDYQLFMKRLRKHFDGRVIRFYMCGEYGEDRGRPHFHACLFNVDFTDQVPAGKSKSGQLFYTSAVLTKLWGLGHCSVQPLVRETASYCARYIMKKVFGQDAESSYTVVNEHGEIVQREPEFARMSLRPGIGARWVDKYVSDVFPLDSVVHNGTRRRVPKFYDRRVKDIVDFDSIEFARQQAAKRASEDNTDERRAVREVVHLAKVRTLKRDL
ncbi:MAG: replication initiator protein [Arizlama microvirus]|nr:MAG: replication initiator protein [Arizlama microvirus]